MRIFFAFATGVDDALAVPATAPKTVLAMRLNASTRALLLLNEFPTITLS
jgi:hypothetical protein